VVHLELQISPQIVEKKFETVLMVYSGAGAGGKLIHEKTTTGRKSHDTDPLNKRLWILQLNTAGLTAKELQDFLIKRIPQHEIPRVFCRAAGPISGQIDIGLLKRQFLSLVCMEGPSSTPGEEFTLLSEVGEGGGGGGGFLIMQHPLFLRISGSLKIMRFEQDLVTVPNFHRDEILQKRILLKVS
jgi:hypothetical protein